MRKSEKSVFIHLASRSERRIELLGKMRLPFKTVPSSYRETPSRDSNPARTVMRHALGKAAAAKLPARFRCCCEEFVLGADTIVYFGRRILGKPACMTAARNMLMALSGRTHRVYTGIALIHRRSGKFWLDYAESKVKFKKIGTRSVEEYLRQVPPLDKAGGYAIQEKPAIVARFEGSRSNIIGLPVDLLRRMLRAAVRAL